MRRRIAAVAMALTLVLSALSVSYLHPSTALGYSGNNDCRPYDYWVGNRSSGYSFFLDFRGSYYNPTYSWRYYEYFVNEYYNGFPTYPRGLENHYPCGIGNDL